MKSESILLAPYTWSNLMFALKWESTTAHALCATRDGRIDQEELQKSFLKFVEHREASRILALRGITMWVFENLLAF